MEKIIELSADDFPAVIPGYPVLAGQIYVGWSCLGVACSFNAPEQRQGPDHHHGQRAAVGVPQARTEGQAERSWASPQVEAPGCQVECVESRVPKKHQVPMAMAAWPNSLRFRYIMNYEHVWRLYMTIYRATSVCEMKKLQMKFLSQKALNPASALFHPIWLCVLQVAMSVPSNFYISYISYIFLHHVGSSSLFAADLPWSTYKNLIKSLRIGFRWRGAAQRLRCSFSVLRRLKFSHLRGTLILGWKPTKGNPWWFLRTEPPMKKNLHCNLIILGCCMGVCYMLLLGVQHAIPSGNQNMVCWRIDHWCFFQLDMGFSI